MKRNVLLVTMSLSMLWGCVSKSKFAQGQTEIMRLKSDSTLLEKRITQYQNENAHLQTLSATIEQALNDRLQEKEDSITFKEKLLKDREFSLRDMKARKEQEQEAFYSLSSKIFAAFTDYDLNTLTTKTNCTQAVVMVNDKKMFVGSSLKPEYLATEINNKAAELLEKHPDLMLTIVCYVDSSMQIAAKEDLWNIAALRANALSKLLISNHKNLAIRVKSATGIPNTNPTVKNQAYYTEYLFVSSLTPCIPVK
jgi:flagellar motor protein MotB